MITKRFFFLLCCIGVASAFALAGCGDDEGGNEDTGSDVTDTSGTDTNVNGTDTTGVDGVDGVNDDTNACCTPASCAGNGLVCNTATCQCQPADPGCASVGAACDTTAAQPASFVCLDNGAGGGVCAAACNSTLACPNGSYCVEQTPGAGGHCEESECSGFFSNNCPTGEKCVPVNETATAFACTAVGTGVEGDTCAADSDCGSGMLCFGTCVTIDCAPESGAASCGAGLVCEGEALFGPDVDLGLCMCDVFGTNTGCAGTEICDPRFRGTNGSILGFCFADPGGTAQIGGACGADETPAQTCADPGMCIGTSSTTNAAECFLPCDPDANTGGKGACSGTSVCSGLQTSDGPLDFGMCLPGCTPFVDPATSGCDRSGCGTDGTCEICFPEMETEGVGLCYASSEGTAAEGDGCQPYPTATTPAAQLCPESENTFCLGAESTTTACTEDTQCGLGYCGSAGTCVTTQCAHLCKPGDTTTCAAGMGCFPWFDYDEVSGAVTTYSVGQCETACTYTPATPQSTCATGEICVTGWNLILDPGFDLCFALTDWFETTDKCKAANGTLHDPPCLEFEECAGSTVAGEEMFTCSGGGACLEPEAGAAPVCTELCGKRNGSCGTAAHPDCTRTDAVCECVFSGTAPFGLCGNPA